jgi:hypothetical protein
MKLLICVLTLLPNLVEAIPMEPATATAIAIATAIVIETGKGRKRRMRIILIIVLLFSMIYCRPHPPFLPLPLQLTRLHLE